MRQKVDAQILFPNVKILLSALNNTRLYEYIEGVIQI